MSRKLILPAILVLVIALSGCTAPAPAQGGNATSEQACTDSGGTVTTQSCCKSTDSFPNTCLIGACGCSPENSNNTRMCDCGQGKCFDGRKCVAIQTPEQGCISSGGTVTTQSCCTSAADFPMTCVIGACGCSPDNSKQVQFCECGQGSCFNGLRCVGINP